jgi:AcrR family transcriptional regulator
MTIADHLTPREEITEGQFQGVLQAHKVGKDEDRLENDADRLFSMTYPSNALQTAFDHVDNKIRGRDSQGGIALSGPYGAGKSHGLLVLYHMFNSPKVAQKWIDNWGISLDLPETAKASIHSTSETDADLIWEPIFRDLGREDILEDIKRYPTTDHLERLSEEEPVAIFFDEIETWWKSFGESENDELLERNEFFLQNLFEVANDPQEDLFTFVTLLDKSRDIRRILNRTNPYSVDMNDTGDREQIILHRLFETPQEDVDEKAIRDVVSEFVDHYTFPIEIDEPKRYENRMVETYPFHPELLDLLDDIYEAGRERQSVRGAMNVLADTVRRKYEETDLIIACDIKASAFRGINQTLFNRYVSDKDAIDDIDFGDDLLRTVFLYTIEERETRASVTECLLGTFKPEKANVDKLHMSLESLYGVAHYLDRDSQRDHYYLTENPRLTALVTREQERALEDDRDSIEETLVDVVRDEVWGNDVCVYPDEDIPDSNDLTTVVMLDYLSNGALQAKLSDFFEGRTYQNTVLFVTPKKESRSDDEIINKAARVLGAKNLRGNVDDDGELASIIRDERRELRNELEDRFGKWVKWSEDPSGDGIRMRRIDVAADVDDVKNKVGRDKTYVGEKIREEIEDAESGIPIASMLNDFRQFRRMPVLLSDEVFYSAVSQLYRDDKIVLEGDRAHFYVPHKGDALPDLNDDLTIHHPDNLDDSIFEEEEPPEPTPTDDGDGGDGGGDGTGSDEGTDGPDIGGGGGRDGGGGGTSTVSTTKKTVELEGNSARILRSQAEARINSDSDTTISIDLNYDVDNLSKQELIELLEQLPSANHIDATVVIESESEN